ncbi:TXD11 protein, partial [Polypterus senegalus]
MQFRLRLSLRQLLIQMARRPDLLCGAIVLSCTLILSVKFAYSRAKNVVSPARPPVRFFSPSAPIIDLYLGQLDQVERLRSNSDVTLIYFYAPWCGESISARVAIEQVAKKLSDQTLCSSPTQHSSVSGLRQRPFIAPDPEVFLSQQSTVPYSFRVRAISPLLQPGSTPYLPVT